MIFHTAAEKIYYKQFYDLYYSTINQFYPASKFSLYYLGQDIPTNKNISYLQQENITIEEIESRYSVTDRDTKGYFALSRWWSMPVVNENIVVSDVDIVALKNISEDIISDIFQKHEVINITRTKKGGTEGGMAMMIMRKDIVADVNNNAKFVLQNIPLNWASDVNVRNFLYKNFSVYSLPEMHVFNKRSDYSTLDATTRSFGIFKGGVAQKVDSLKKATGL